MLSPHMGNYAIPLLSRINSFKTSHLLNYLNFSIQQLKILFHSLSHFSQTQYNHILSPRHVDPTLLTNLVVLFNPLFFNPLNQNDPSCNIDCQNDLFSWGEKSPSPSLSLSPLFVYCCRVSSHYLFLLKLET